MTSSRIIPLPLGLTVASYRFERPLAMGGFSIVYLATAANGARVAIKEYLPAQLASRMVGLIPQVKAEQRAAYQDGMMAFFEEGIALSGIEHPNVVRVLDFFRAHDTVYLVMRFEEGETLAEHIRREPLPLPEDFLRAMLDGLLAGLTAVHGHGLLHLDLKPANILLRTDGTPVLLDFGAARQALTRRDPGLRTTFTPGYAAPEQYRAGGLLSPRTDLYALGATLYACLTGQPPPPADLRLIEDNRTSLSPTSFPHHAPVFLQTIGHCLALDEADRPESAQAIRQALSLPMETTR